MDATFDQVIGQVLKHEGGFVNHPKDPGGATNKGVTLRTFRRYVKSDGSVADLKRLTDRQARLVYRRHYWDAIVGADLPAGVDYAVFDLAVNSGVSRASKILQKVVGATQDGRIGPATMARVETFDEGELIDAICDERLAFMKRIRGGRLWKTFGRGWQRRVDDVRRVAHRLDRENAIARMSSFVGASASGLPDIPADEMEGVLRDKGSRTIEAADQIRKESWVDRAWSFVTMGGVGVASLFDGAVQFARDNPWVIVALAAMAVAVYFVLQHRKAKAAERVIAARVDDAVTGRNSARLLERLSA
ncbi:MAG: glycosyl hydrolase 108 family protein [Pseudomonadota bacterium]